MWWLALVGRCRIWVRLFFERGEERDGVGWGVCAMQDR